MGSVKNTLAGKRGEREREREMYTESGGI